MLVARVILKEARSYRHGGRRFIKDVPQTIKGEEVKEYLTNGFFTVVVLKGKEELQSSSAAESSKKAPAKVEEVDEDDDDEDEEDEPAKGGKSATKKPGAGLKKRT